MKAPRVATNYEIGLPAELPQRKLRYCSSPKWPRIGALSLALLGTQFLRTPEPPTPCRFNSEIDMLCTMVASALDAGGPCIWFGSKHRAAGKQPGAVVAVASTNRRG